MVAGGRGTDRLDGPLNDKLGPFSVQPCCSWGQCDTDYIRTYDDGCEHNADSGLLGISSHIFPQMSVKILGCETHGLYITCAFRHIGID